MAKIILLNGHLSPIWIQRLRVCVLPLFFFSFFLVSRIFWLLVSVQCTPVYYSATFLATFQQLFIKNGSHGTIHTFKIYFATVFSLFSKINCIQRTLSMLTSLIVFKAMPQRVYIGRQKIRLNQSSCRTRNLGNVSTWL